MSKAAVKPIKLLPFDATEYLDDTETIAAYLTLVIGEGDAEALASALISVAMARGIDVAAYAENVLRYETVYRLCKELGIHLAAVPVGNKA